VATFTSHPLRRAGLGLLALAVIYGVVGAYDPAQLWSTNLLARLSTSWQVVLTLGLVATGISLLIYSPRPQNKNLRQERSKKNKPVKEVVEVDTADNRFIRWPALVAVVFAGICFAFPIEWSMLGDSTLFIGYGFRFENSGHLTMPPREFLSVIISQTLYGLLSSLSESQVASALPFRIIGAVAAFIWCFVSIKLADLVTTSRPLKYLTLVLLLTCAGSLFFFGYVETYPLPYAAALWVLYLAFKHLRGECSDVLLLSALALSMLLHLQNLLLIPAVGYALAKRRKPEFTINWKTVAIIVGAMLIVYGYFQINPIAKFSSADNPFIPVMSVEDLSYTLFSSQHLLDVLNEHLLLAPCALILLAAIKRGTMDWKRPEIQITLISLFFYEAFLIGANVQFGMARDWDIFALLGPLCIVLAVLLWQQCALEAGAYRRLAIGLSLASLVCVGQWFYVNFDVATSLNRYDRILALHEPLISKRNSHYGYENLRKVSSYFHPSQELYVIDKMLDLQPWPVTTERVVKIAVQKRQDMGPSEFAQLRKIRDKILAMEDSLLLVEEVGEDKLRVDVPHSASNLNHADIFNSLVTYEATEAKLIDSTEAYRLANEFIRLHPRLPQGYELMAALRLLLDRSHLAESIPFASRAIELDSARPRPYLYLAWAEGLLWNVDEARFCLRRSLELDPTWLDAITSFAQFLERLPAQSRHKEDFALVRASCNVVLIPDPNLQKSSVDLRHEKATKILRKLSELEQQAI
jgi:tetratricopeptide (TPR) repeat protein